MLVKAKVHSEVLAAPDVVDGDDTIFSVLDDSGVLRPGARPPAIADADALRLFRGMLQVRLVDERMLRLQRQGRLGFYMTSTGEEATHFAVHALDDGDWIFPSYREPGAAFYRGYSIRDFTNQLFGNAEDPVKGRQMPVHHSFRAKNFVSISSPVGTQLPQAVGMALAARISKKRDVALAYFGEGTASTGDFHVAMNFAGVLRAPVIFFCRNNGWAISTKSTLQTASRTIAEKAVAYGFPGARVDGNDLLAILAVMEDAVARARAGEGPTLIEAVTYRRGAHSSSDDPSVYRDPDEPKQWERRDPIERFRRYLVGRDLWSEDLEARYRKEIVDEIVAAIQHAEITGPPPVETMFDDVYADLPPHLAEQREYLLSLPRATGGHGAH
jgi:TPP-dependent pyruvate/acetoin dehydrogenase alpha subunit